MKFRIISFYNARALVHQVVRDFEIDDKNRLRFCYQDLAGISIKNCHPAIMMMSENPYDVGAARSFFELPKCYSRDCYGQPLQVFYHNTNYFCPCCESFYQSDSEDTEAVKDLIKLIDRGENCKESPFKQRLTIIQGLNDLKNVKPILFRRCKKCAKHKHYECMLDGYKYKYKHEHSDFCKEYTAFLTEKFWDKFKKKEQIKKEEIRRAAFRHYRRHYKTMKQHEVVFFQLLCGASELKKWSEKNEQRTCAV